MYDSIRIQNFRGIRDLTISNLGRINLLVGGNDVGKTSVLEALALLHSHPGVFELRQILDSRGYSIKEAWTGALSSMVRVDSDEEFCVEAKEIGGKEVALWASPYDSVREKIQNFPKGNGESSTSFHVRVSIGNSIEQMFLEFIGKTTSMFDPMRNWEAEYQVDFRKPLELPAPKETNAFGEVAYLPSQWRIRHGLLPQLVTQLNRTGKLNSALEAINAFDNRVVDLEVAAAAGQTSVDAVVRISEGEGSASIRVPWSAIGDGVRRLWEMLVMLPRAESGIGLVDEVDIGVYYENIPKLWKALSTISAESTVQLFTTTHSWECVQAAIQVFRSDPNAFRMHRLDRIDGTLRVTTYDHEMAEAALELNVEVR